MMDVRTTQRILLIAGAIFISISEGYIIGMMSGMVAGLQSEENSDVKLSENQISWLASSLHGTCLCGFAVAAFVTEKFGRKRALTMLTSPVIIHWLILYFVRDFVILMLSMVMVGVCFGGVMSLGLLSTAEYTSPKIRAACLSIIISGGPVVGTTTAHILSTVIHWRKVALVGVVPTALSALIPCFWIESPTWLASKGRFQECEAAFTSLHGNSKAAHNELSLLLEVEKCKQKNAPKSAVLKKLFIAMKQRYFWKIAMLVCVLHVYRVAGAKLLLNTFTITILQDITGRSHMLLFTMLVDGFLVFGCGLSYLVTRRFKVRPILFTSGILSNVILLSLSACLYFKPSDDINLIWLSCLLLGLYFVTASAGLFPVIECLFAEVFPLELKMYCLFGFGTIGSLALFLSIQTALTMFSTFGYHGVFLINAILATFCLIYLWFKLPETKGRTLQEIELYFKNDTFDNVIFDEEQVQVLLGANVKV